MDAPIGGEHPEAPGGVDSDADSADDPALRRLADRLGDADDAERERVREYLESADRAEAEAKEEKNGDGAA